MKTRNTMTLSYHSKVTSTQNKVVPYFSCLAHGVWYLSQMFGLSHSFSDNSNLIIFVEIQRLHENDKWILGVSNGVYILFKNSFLAALYCLIKSFHLQQS